LGTSKLCEALVAQHQVLIRTKQQELPKIVPDSQQDVLAEFIARLALELFQAISRSLIDCQHPLEFEQSLNSLSERLTTLSGTYWLVLLDDKCFSRILVDPRDSQAYPAEMMLAVGTTAVMLRTQSRELALRAWKDYESELVLRQKVECEYKILGVKDIYEPEGAIHCDRIFSSEGQAQSEKTPQAAGSSVAENDDPGTAVSSRRLNEESESTHTGSTSTHDASQNGTAEREARSFARTSIVKPILNRKGWTIGAWGTRAAVGKSCPYEYLSGKRRKLTKKTHKALADELGLKPEQLPN
jgi:hypothetical protein